MKEKYKDLYSESVELLEHSTDECSRMEKILKQKGSKAIDSARRIVNGMSIEALFLTVFICIAVVGQLLFRV